MCFCFRQRRVRHSANYVAYTHIPGCLLCPITTFVFSVFEALRWSRQDEEADVYRDELDGRRWRDLVQGHPRARGHDTLRQRTLSLVAGVDMDRGWLCARFKFDVTVTFNVINYGRFEVVIEKYKFYIIISLHWCSIQHAHVTLRGIWDIRLN